jgi:hypothetical protein
MGSLKLAIKKCNYQLSDVIYRDEVAVDEVQTILANNGLTMVNEDGTPFCGIFCGSEGSTKIDIAETDNHVLVMSWYTMQTGRIENNCYIS